MHGKINFTFLLLLVSIFAFSQSKIQSPDEFLPHKLGSQYTDHATLVAYYQHVASNSDRVKLVEFGKTNQERPQILAIVSSPENMLRIEEIRKNNLRLTGLESGQFDAANPITVVWLGFSVHGNEAAGSEASMGVVFDLVNPANTQSSEWLKNTVVLIEPSVNPDGYSRYTDWYRNVSPTIPDVNPEAREHVEPWPGGRVNHYYFDLNRDWAWASQVESQNRLTVYNDWMPHVVADLHEQGYNDPYYFAPAAQPYHKFLTQWQADFQVEIGRNHAKYFDKNGWLYFTKEIFDLFYPSYGDTYPCFNGAVGMTYEQGGIRAGRAISLENGDTLTLADRVAHHRTTALSTVEISSKNAAKVVRSFGDFFSRSLNNPPGTYKSFVVKSTNPPAKIRALTTLLDRHAIRYGKAGNVQSGIAGYDFLTNKEGRVAISENDLVISAYQPKGLLAQVLLEPSPELVDSLTYDITAWSLLQAYGLEAFAVKQRIDPSGNYDFGKQSPIPGGATPYAYLVPWNSLQSAKFLASILKNGVVARCAEGHFETEGNAYAPGTLVITRADNRKNNAFDQTVREAAADFGVEIRSVSSGMVTSGADFGSEDMRLVVAPKVLLFSGEKTYDNEFGQVWFYFDKEIQYPATIVDADRLEKMDISEYDLLVLGEGYYDLSDETAEKLGAWVSKGGRLIAIGQANSSLADKKGFNLVKDAADADTEEEDRQKDLEKRKAIYEHRDRLSLMDNLPGAVVRVKMDKSHPLGFGMRDYFNSLKTNSLRYDLLKDSWNVGYLESDFTTFGFIGSNKKSSLKNSVVFAVQDKGRGKVIYLIDNPLFRAFWEEGKFLFSNAVFLVN